MALGETRDGKRCCLLVVSQGNRVTSREPLFLHPEQGQLDWAWREEAYRRYFRQEKPTDAERLKVAREVAPLKGGDVHSGEGVGLAKLGRLWTLYRLEFEGEKILREEVEEASTDFLYMWDRLSTYADRFLLGDWRARI